MSDARARRDAVLAGYRDDEAAARTLLTHESGSVRASALGALARGKNLGDGDLQVSLADADPIVRRRSCALAATRTTIDLRPLLGDIDASVVEVAAWAIGEQGRNDAVEELTEIVYKHENALCREAAVAALGTIGDEAGLPAILHATTDKPAIRRRAIIALAPFDGEEVQTQLQNALEDRDWQVRQAAEALLEINNGPDTDENSPNESSPSEESPAGAPHPDEEWPFGS